MKCRCIRCGHNWESRSLLRKPVQCPWCKSPFWNTPYAHPEWHKAPDLTDYLRAKKPRGY